jgi:hypothetical protein
MPSTARGSWIWSETVNCMCLILRHTSSSGTRKTINDQQEEVWAVPSLCRAHS